MDKHSTSANPHLQGGCALPFDWLRTGLSTRRPGGSTTTPPQPLEGTGAAQADAFVRDQQKILSQALDTTLTTLSDIVGLDARIDMLSWMMGILIAIAVANLAKQFF